MPEDGEWETAVAGDGNHFLVQFFFKEFECCSWRPFVN